MNLFFSPIPRQPILRLSLGVLLTVAGTPPLLASAGSGSAPCLDLLHADATPTRTPKQIAEDTISSNEFQMYRGLTNYTRNFGEPFARELIALKHGDVWVDSGAGAGAALIQYLAAAAGDLFPWTRDLFYPVERARVVGIAKTEPHRNKSYDGERFRYLGGRYIEEIPAEEIGPANLITDFFGPLSYSAHPDIVLRKYLEILHPVGSLWVWIQEDLTEFYRPDKTKQKKMSIADAFEQLFSRDSRKSFFNWLGTIPGITVERQESGALRIQKTGRERILVPSVVLDKTDGGSPPQRTFCQLDFEIETVPQSPSTGTP